MEKTEAHRLPRVVLNERRLRAVKLRLSGVTIAETVSQCELGVRLSKVLADGDSGASDWQEPELVVESAD